MKKHPTPQDVLKSLIKTKHKIAFVPETEMAISKEKAEQNILEYDLSENYAVAIIFTDHKRIKHWLIASVDEIKQHTEVA